MANFKRRHPVTKAAHGAKNMSSWPKWWDVVFHTRPRRRAIERMRRAIESGRVDPDDAAMPLGNHKPHQYFW